MLSAVSPRHLVLSFAGILEESWCVSGSAFYIYVLYRVRSGPTFCCALSHSGQCLQVTTRSVNRLKRCFADQVPVAGVISVRVLVRLHLDLHLGHGEGHATAVGHRDRRGRGTGDLQMQGDAEERQVPVIIHTCGPAWLRLVRLPLCHTYKNVCMHYYKSLWIKYVKLNI